MTYTVDTIDMLSDLPVATKTFENVDLYPGREMLSHIVANTPDVELLLVQNGVVVGDIATDGTTTMRPQSPPSTPGVLPPTIPATPPTPGTPLPPATTPQTPWVPRNPSWATDTPSTDYTYMAYDEATDTPPTAGPVTHLPIPAPARATRIIFTADNPQFTVDGQQRTSQGTPFIDPATNRMMVPLRTLVEATGQTVEWDSANRAALIHLPTGTLTIPAGELLPDGMGTVIIVGDRVFIPLRFVMYAFDATVEWDSANRGAIITMR
jgi:hypothetical protein